MYDPFIGRWTSAGPMAEKYYHLSPYAFCHNNAVNAVDPDGRDDFFDENGRFINHVDTATTLYPQEWQILKELEDTSCS